MTGSAGPDAEWWRGGARRFGDGVRRRYDSPESFSAAGEEALGAGDVAAALCFFGGAVGLLHTHYDVRQFTHREPAAADDAVLNGLLRAMPMAVRERSAAAVREFTESITEQLVDVARACAANGFDGGRYLAAAETLGNLVGADGSRLAQAAPRPSRPEASGAGPTAAAIAAEWALHDDATAVARWHEGFRRYDDAPLDSQAELNAAAELMCEVLAHYVAGECIVPDSWAKAPEEDIARTVWNVLVASLDGSDDRTWSPAHERRVRLAMAVARMARLESTELGGRSLLTRFLDDSRQQELIERSLSPYPAAFDLRTWFTHPEEGP